jgi:hypothetical protein
MRPRRQLGPGWRKGGYYHYERDFLQSKMFNRDLFFKKGKLF